MRLWWQKLLRNLCLSQWTYAFYAKKLEQLGESWTEVTPPIIFKKAAQNNTAAKEVINEFATVLAQALAGIMNTIDVEEIIIGGGVSEAGADLLDPLMEKLEMYVFLQLRITSL